MFKKGEPSPNPGGRPKSELLKLLSKHLLATDPVKKKKHGQLVVEALVQAAEEREEWAQEMLWNRMELKVKEQVAIEGGKGAQLTIQIVKFSPDEGEKK